MPKFRVHIYREMRLVFDNIEAESPQAAAELAARKDFDDRDGFDDCEGATFAALVDEEGQDEGTLIDFEEGRLLRAGPKLLKALANLLPEIDSEIEQRQHGGNAEDWIALQRLSDEAHAAVCEATGATLYTVGSSHGELTVDVEGRILDRRLDNADADGGGHLARITRFDVAEWRKHWGNPQLARIDILDLGYWYADAESNRTAYAPPDAKWRSEIAEILLERRAAAEKGAAV